MAPSVNRPTNVRLRDDDIDRKLQLYGIANAFGIGKMPANDQIDASLNSFLQSRALSRPSSKLSAEGRTLVADVRDVVESAKMLLLSKNEGNLIQDFVWKTSQQDYSSVSAPGAALSKSEARQDGDQALAGLKTLGNLLITNGQFRKLLKDASVLFRDIVTDQSTKATEVLRPSDDDLAQLDEAAPDGTFHDAPDWSKEKESLRNRTNALKKNKNGAADDATAAAADKKIEYRDRVQAYMRSKMPQQRKDQTIWRLKKMVLECQQHPDYQQAIQTLLDLAERYHGAARTTATSAGSAAGETRGRMSEAEANLKTLIERFANGTSTDTLWRAIASLYKKADNDRELRGWFSDTDAYLRRCLQQEGYILEDAAADDYTALAERGRFLLREKYRAEADGVVDQAKMLADQFERDPQNAALRRSLSKLFRDLGNDSRGRATFKPHLVRDLASVVLPAALESIAYIPVPRLEYSDAQVDAVIENLVIESDNFAPNVFEVHNSNYMSWGRKLGASKVGANRHGAQVNVSGIQMDLRNISYYVRKKSGFPSMTDVGVFSVILPGDGFGFQLGLRSASPTDRQHFFQVERVRVNLGKLKITLHQSQHKLLFGVCKPILLRIMRPVLQKVAGKAIRDAFNDWDATLYSIHQEAKRAGEIDPNTSGNAYSRFAAAAQKRMQASKEQKHHEAEAKRHRAAARRAAAVKRGEEPEDEKKLNVAVTQDDSIFPHIRLPGGFSNRASRYRDMAHEGQDWRSPVFTLGSGGLTQNVPTAKIQEKNAYAENGKRSQSGGVTTDGGGADGRGTTGNGAVYTSEKTGYDGINSGGVNYQDASAAKYLDSYDGIGTTAGVAGAGAVGAGAAGAATQNAGYGAGKGVGVANDGYHGGLNVVNNGIGSGVGASIVNNGKSAVNNGLGDVKNGLNNAGTTVYNGVDAANNGMSSAGAKVLNTSGVRNVRV